MITYYIYITHVPEPKLSRSTPHLLESNITSQKRLQVLKPACLINPGLRCIYSCAYMHTCIHALNKKRVHICTYGIMWVHRHTTSYTIIHVGIVHCRCTWISLHTLNTARLCYKMLQTCTYGRERETRRKTMENILVYACIVAYTSDHLCT